MLIVTLLTNLGVGVMSFCFKLVLQRKTGKEIPIPESSRLEFLEKILANNFTLSDLPFWRHYQQFVRSLKSQVSGKSHSFALFYQHMQVWQHQEYFSSNYQPACTLLSIQENYSVDTNKKNEFYELWQQHKQKAVEMSEAWPDIYNEGHIHQFQHEPTLKIHLQQQKH